MNYSTDISRLNPRELVIFDASVGHIQQLIDGIKSGIDWTVLNANQDGIEQITRILANYPDIQTLHILSHGAPGCLFLGNTQLSLDTLEGYTTQLHNWFASSPPNPQHWGSKESKSAIVQSPPALGDLGGKPSLLLYGCKVAAGDAGEEFINKLHNVTQANIAASANLTGNAALGGDWELEMTLGQGQFVPAFTSETLATYSSVLDSGESPVSKLPAFAQKWLDKNNPVPNVFITETDNPITATYDGTLDITANINEILTKLKLKNITQEISATNPTLVVQGTLENPTGYQFSVNQVPVGEMMNGLGELSNKADLFNGLSSTGNIDLVLSDKGVKVTYPEAVQLDINDIIDTSTVIDADNVVDTSNTNTFVQKAIENIEKALSNEATDATTIILKNSVLEVTHDAETEIKIESVINDEKVTLRYQTPTNLSFSLPDFDGVDLSNILGKFAANIPGINLPKLASFDWETLNLKGLDFEFSLIDGIPDFKFTLPNLPVANLKSLFDGFGLSVPSLDFVFDLPNLPSLSLSIGTDLFKIEGLDLDFNDFLKGFGVDIPSLPDFNFNLPSLDISFINGIPNIEIPSLSTDFIEDLIPTIGVDFQFAKDLLNPIVKEAKKFKVEPKKDEIKITYLDDVNISSIVETVSEEAGLNLDLEDLTVKNPGLRIKKQEDGKRLYEVSIGEFSPTEAVNFLTGEAGVKLPDTIQNQLNKVGKVALSASKQGFGLTYLDNITLDVNSLIDSDGFFKDAANTVASTFLGDGDENKAGTQLVLAKPEVEFTKKDNNKTLSLASSFNGNKFDLNFDVNFDSNFSGTKIPQLSGFDFELPELDITQLETLFQTIGGTELPGFAKELLNTLGSLNLSDFNIEVGEGELAVSYLGEIEIAEIVNSLSEVLGLGENVLSDSLTVKNPGLRIAKDQEGNFDYEVSIGEFSPTEVVSLLGDVVGIESLPSVIQNELDKVGKVGLIASNKGLTLNYLDDITLDVNSLIDSDGFLKDAANVVTEAFLGDGDENADGTQLVLAESQLEFVKDEKTKELSFAGNFNGTDFKFGLDLNTELNSGSGSLTTPKLSELEFNLPQLDATKLKEAFETIAGTDLPEFAEDLLTTLASLANFDVELSDDGFAVTYLGTLNISNIINSLSSTLGLGDSLLSEPLSVTNPGLRIGTDNAGNKIYEVSIGEFSPTEAVNFLSDTLGVELPDTIQSELDKVGKVALAASNQGFTLTYLDNVVVDVNSLISIEGIVQDAANAITKELLGDGDDAEGTQLVLAKPELEFTTQNNSKELSIAGNFNGTDFKFGFDINSSSNSGLGSTSGGLTIPKLSELEFDLPELDATKIQNTLSSLAGISLPSFTTSFLDKLASVGNNLQIGFNDGGFQLTSLGDIDISSILKSLAPSLSVDSFNVKNPGLTIESGASGGLEFGISVGEFSPGKLIDLLVGLLPDSVPLPTDVLNQIKSLGNTSLSLTTEGISVTYLENITLDLNSLIGDNFGSLGFVKDAINKVSEVVFGDADSTLDGTQFELATPKLEWTTDSFDFGGLLNDKEFNLGLGEGLEFNYEFGDLNLSSILGDIPGLEGFKLDETQLSFSDGLNFEGKVDFTDKTDAVSQFINQYLGVDNVGIDLGIGAGGVSLEGVLAGNIPLLSIKDFKATLNDVALGLEVGAANQALGIGGSITLEGYDPVQSSEPPLTLYGDLILDPKAITGSFQMKTEGDQSWENPFGFPNTSLKNLALQIGATYVTPWVDNVGFVGDLTFGDYDLKTAFLVDTNDPQKFALDLTVNEPLPLRSLLLGPVYSYVLSTVGNEVPIIQKGIDFVDSIIDLNVVSIDSDDDGKRDPLISIVPVNTTIAKKKLSQGIGVNGAVTAWGKEATLTFNLNPFSTNPEISGSLKIPEIDLAGIVKISGVEDSVSGGTDTDVNLDLKVSLSEQYFQGDGQLEILGREVAKVDFKVSPSGIEIKDFDFDIFVTKLDVNNLDVYSKPQNIDGVNVIAQGNGSFNLLGHQVAGTDFKITTSGIDINHFNLDVGVFELNVNDFFVDFNNMAARGQANVKVFNQEVAAVDFDISSQKFELKDFDLDFGFVDLDVDNLIFDTTGNASGSGSLEIGGNKVANAEIKTLGDQLTIDGNLDLFGLIKIDNAQIDVKSSDNLEITGAVQFLDQQLADASVIFQDNTLTVEGDLSLELPLLGQVSTALTITSDGTLQGSIVKLDSVLGSFEGSLNDGINSIEELADKAFNELGGAELVQTFDDLVEIGTETLNSVTDFTSNTLNSTFSRLEGVWNDVLNFVSAKTKKLLCGVPIVGGFLDCASDGNDDLRGNENKNEHDKLDAKGGHDQVFGFGGDDWLIGGSGNDTVWGGFGKDRIEGNNDHDLLYGEWGSDKLEGGGGNDTLYGGHQDSTNHPDNSSDLLIGGNESDVLYGGRGNDVLQGDQGDDVLHGQDDHDKLEGDGGRDSLSGWSGNDYLDGGSGDDRLVGGTGDDYLLGGTGNDYLLGQDDNDTLIGGTGNDLLDGGTGNDLLDGGSGEDTLSGSFGDDTLIGGDGNDYLNGMWDNDTLIGGDGNDYLNGSTGESFLIGGDGNDTLSGGEGNDTLSGGEGNDNLWGWSGDDYLSGGEGNDLLNGGSGNDLLDGGSGDDTLSGGADNDTLIGGSGEDYLNGRGSDDLLLGGAGKDTIFGEVGDDTLIGGEGNDTLLGGSGNDLLLGGDGDDTLDPGTGNDTIDGGAGHDILVLSGTESDYTFTETDTGWTITDNRDNTEKTVAGVEEFYYKLEGSAANGPLAGATAFIDTNGNFVLDEGESQTTTDNNGEYSFAIDPAALDSNGDGTIDLQEAQIVVTGGIDTTTGLPGAIPLISPIGSTADHASTTPLTTLKTVLASQDIEAAQVETLLNKISGLSLSSLSQPLDNFDPYAAIGEDNSDGINIASGHIKVMNLLLNGTTFLEAAGYSEADAQIQVIIGLGDVLQTVNNFNLSETNNLQTLFTELSQKLNLSVNSEVVAAVSELVAESNHLVDDLVEEALSRAVSDVLPTINPIKQAVYSQLPEVTTQLVAGEITTEESQTQLQELLNSDTYLVQFALNENRTVQVSASDTVTSEENIISETSFKADGSTSTSATVTEGENSNGHFIITLGEAAPAQGLKILYTLSGTATLGQDYESENGQFGEIIVEPGETEAVIDLTMLDDDIAERPESITINLRYVGDGYVLNPNAQSAVLDITDNDEANTADAETGLDQTGTFGDDTLVGTDADDYLSGGYGDDMVFGQGGNDDIMGAAGKDTVFGGQGNDNIEGNFGADVLHGNKGDDILAGGSDNDIIEGHEGSDQLHGDSGDDYLQGNEGNDVIKGGLGNDLLKGNQDNDWLIGGSGEDILMGGQGVDLFNGGDGADVFFFNVAAEGGDLILDFDPAQGDKIQVSEIGFNTTSLEDFSFMAGTLYFQDQELALVQNNGQTYNHFADLSEILEIVSEPTRPEVENTAVLSANITPRVPDINLVENPETTILDEIIQRGQITVATPASGVEFDLEFARTLAAALFGDASKVETVTTTFDEAVSFVADGTVDLVAQRSTETLGRDATLNVDFSPTYFYDHQAIVVRNDSGIDSVLDLNGRTIGVIEGTTALGNLQNQLGAEGIEFTPQQFSTSEEMMAAYDQGLIDAYSRDRTLILDHLNSLPDSANNRLLDVELSKEPIALALPENDSQWADIVRWVNYVPVQAEEFGISSQNIDQLIQANTDENENNDSDPAIRRFLGLEGDLGQALGLNNDFAVQVIQQVGNSAEIHDRHFPELDRDRNLLWTDGGLLYSPPFSGSPIDGELVDNNSRNLLVEVLERGSLKLGLAGPGSNPGFAVQQEDGEYAGFDVDLGRAIAAAIFGDASKLEIQTQSFKDSFANTANGVVDVSAMGITENLVRDASLGIDYSPTYLYTGQGILVKADSGIDMLPALNGRRIGVLESATALQNLQDSVGELGGTFTPVTYGSNDELFAAYEAGDIDAVSTDLTILSARIPTLSNPDEHQLLDDVLSKEPLALITDENQSDWSDVVRWVTHALVQAEEYGITSENIDQFLANNIDDIPDNDSNSAIRQFLGLEGNLGESLGLPNDFVVNIIKAVGNYGEIYDRHFNSDVLRRDRNELVSDFGLQYAPPFSGAGNTNVIAGSPADDNLEATNAREYIYGYQGNDLIIAQDGNDFVYGGQGNDTVQAGNGNDYVWGNAGNDWLNGNQGNDRVNGGDGDDELYGGQGDDLLIGAAGNDTVTGGEGSDRFVLTPGSGSNLITDFTDGEDLLDLEEGLTFDQLTIEPAENATIVKFGDEVLATLNGVESSLITADDFTSLLENQV